MKTMEKLTVEVEDVVLDVSLVDVLVDVVLVEDVDVSVLVAEPPAFWFESGSWPAFATAPWSPPPNTGS